MREYADLLREYAEVLREKVARSAGEIATISSVNMCENISKNDIMDTQCDLS